MKHRGLVPYFSFVLSRVTLQQHKAELVALQEKTRLFLESSECLESRNVYLKKHFSGGNAFMGNGKVGPAPR